MSEQTRSTALLILIWTLVAAAALTLLPMQGPRPNDLDYFSLCPFAPWSSLILLLAAGLVGAIRQYLVTRRG